MSACTEPCVKAHEALHPATTIFIDMNNPCVDSRRNSYAAARPLILTTSNVLKLALDTFKDVAGGLGVPGLQAGIGVLSAVLALVQVRPTYLTLCTEFYIMLRTHVQTLKLSLNWRRKSMVCRSGFRTLQSFMAQAYILSCTLGSKNCYRMCATELGKSMFLTLHRSWQAIINEPRT